jgi:exopolysaccharide biosynthesis polyprenyl glycosylphosphotransferase
MRDSADLSSITIELEADVTTELDPSAPAGVRSAPASPARAELPVVHGRRIRASESTQHSEAAVRTVPLAVALSRRLPFRELAASYGIRRVEAWMLVLPVDALMLMSPGLWAPRHAKAFLTMAVLALLLFTNGGRYRARLHLSLLDELPVLLAKSLTAAAVVAVVTALRHEQEAVTSFLSIAVAAIGLLILGRLITTQIILFARRRGFVAHPTLIVGGGILAGEVIEILRRHPRYGLSVVGFIDDNDTVNAAEENAPKLGALGELGNVVKRHDVEVILVTQGEFSEAELLELVRQPACHDCDLLVVPRLHQFHTQVGLADHIGAIPVMRIRTPSLRGLAWTVKRIFDVVVSCAALVVLSPVFAVCALAVRIEGGPGVLFRQERVGRNGRVFYCLKFRSMRPIDDVEAATRWTVAGDDRIGPVGRVLRRTSLDELPQLINILRGEMTLIGPRPERPHFVQKFAAELPRYQHRHRVPAGLTGLAQVSGLRGDTPIADRARYDNYYIENWSLWLDIKVLLRTVSEVLFARGR